MDGVDAVSEVPADRWNLDRYYAPQAVLGKTYSRWGGFLDNIADFEPEIFGISPREAAFIDPQQRLLLEVSWDALYDAGQVVESLAASATGVFVGISTSDYAQIQSSAGDQSNVGVHSATGGAFSIAANRISYCLDLRGPSIAVDTACSSSLVAADLACKSLWSGECELAIAGGVNAIISAGPFIGFCAASMLSPDGRCRTFDAGANGFVRGEGAGAVLLKPLSKALADGDGVYAVILGSAVNQDGRTHGLTMPSVDAQKALLREACRQAGVSSSIAFSQRTRKCNIKAKQLIDDGAIGRILQMEEMCLVATGLDGLPKWQSDPENLGTLFGHGVHNLDRIRWFTGQEIKTVYAKCGSLEQDGAVEGTSTLLMTLTDGTVASFWCSFQVPKPSFPRSQFRTRIVGEKGLIDLDAYGELRLTVDGQWQVVETQAPIDWAGAGFLDPVRLESYTLQCQDFIDAIVAGRPPQVVGWDGRQAVAAALAAYESAQTSREIVLSS